MNEQILVISSEDDISTEEVLGWLSYYNIPFVRINDQDKLSINRIDVNNAVIELTVNNDTIINLAAFKHFWYRRGFFNFDIKGNSNTLVFKDYLSRELDKVSELIEFYIEKSFHINKPSDNHINKLKALTIAQSLGIPIPHTEIYPSIPLKDNLITKGISELGGKIKLPDSIIFYGKGVHVLNNDDFQNREIFPSLFQNYIEKKYEIRSFYLHGRFQSMAIFSQQNEQTKYDFRNYDYDRPNRCVPYKLPNEMEDKLHKLMQILNINCGSMDIIFGEDNNYYFLEVNPIGQFQWLSKNCNYFIERQIAECLKPTDNE